MRTNLYRHFDATGRLLYVGISLSAVARLKQHRDASPWFESIANVTIETLDTREAAIHAEKKAIKSESPLHNIMHGTNVVRLPSPPPTGPDLSRRDLVAKTAQFKPMYTIAEAAIALEAGEQSVRGWLNEGKLGFVELPSSGATIRRRITGWQLIDFIEYWQAARRVTHR